MSLIRRNSLVYDNKIVYELVNVNNEQIRLKINDTQLILQKEILFNNLNINQILNETTDLTVFLLQQQEQQTNNKFDFNSINKNNNNKFDYQQFAFANSIMNIENNERVSGFIILQDD